MTIASRISEDLRNAVAPRVRSLVILAAAICLSGPANWLSAQTWVSTPPSTISFIGGSVGIGTATPATTLQVQGTLTMSGGGSNGSLIQTENTSTAVGLAGASTFSSGASFWAYGQTHAAYPGNAYVVSGGAGITGTGVIEFANRSSAGYSPRMDILANGNVGIGTTTPGARLNVVGTSGDPSLTANYGSPPTTTCSL